jgi:PBP1b-binding outer membrane lipoprotein LpoB
MKKILSLLAILVVALSLTGCSGPDEAASGRMGSVESEEGKSAEEGK